MLKNVTLTLPHAIVIAVSMLVLGGLVFKGTIPAIYLTSLLFYFLPSPMQSTPVAGPITTQNNIEVAK